MGREKKGNGKKGEGERTLESVLDQVIPREVVNVMIEASGSSANTVNELAKMKESDRFAVLNEVERMAREILDGRIDAGDAMMNSAEFIVMLSGLPGLLIRELGGGIVDVAVPKGGDANSMFKGMLLAGLMDKMSRDVVTLVVLLSINAYAAGLADGRAGAQREADERDLDRLDRRDYNEYE